ncbi:MAG: citramalate synthase, partial [Oscillospiraceae bacterium]
MSKQNGVSSNTEAFNKIKNIKVLDSTLRDGGQAEGISFSVEDKIKIVKLLDNLGVSYIEAGNPGSNPKDLEFFNKAKEITFKNSKLCAFGSTRKKGIKAEDDENLKSLLSAKTPVTVVFGKTWDFHVTDIIKTTLEENLLMIEETIAFLKSKGKEVIFDAEHFFDGYKSNNEYAIKCLLAAEKGGADTICLCETNGGAFPDEIFSIVTDVCEKVGTEIGIHTHNDTGMAVANSVMAVFAGAKHIQGTLIGFGERCGNANLSSIIANLQLKKGYTLIPEKSLSELTSVCRNVSEISNISLDKGMPYVGKSAFTHKAGMHIDGVNKSSVSFEHVPPTSVGNERRFLMSEVAGRSTLVGKIQKFYPSITKESPVATKIIDRIKELEHDG